ncbi:protein methyltransferase [Grosmannia clavigera kw1407]|uniref:Protein arginine N-methyltransferase n=1 Tax=Grosmannia clavigera (strain kw1407 / UAMH 11150) TaxID=655863 RepID=F0X7K3_GROCL|nr:protein methyltransferase [Grosmannia clavigera kw1407]EFX06655.1 protein methyltransferase [Grosmannia clavigera kw1407]
MTSSYQWPTFFIGQHDAGRQEPLDDKQYGYLLDAGFSFATAPITNSHFHDRVRKLHKSYLDDVKARNLTDAERANPSFPGPTISTLTDDDTGLFPGRYITSVIACSSAWIDLYSDDPLVANLSRQVLNLEVAYASFCGVRSIIVPGPRADSSGKHVAQYARAIQEALQVANRASLVIQVPMYREPGLEESIETLSGPGAYPEATADQEIDIYGCWDSWHTIRTVCDYNSRLSVAIRIPRRLPEIELQSRWFAEPLQILTFDAAIFQLNASGFPSLGKSHKEMLNRYMRLKMAPWMLVSNGGPDVKELAAAASSNGSNGITLSPNAAEFLTLAEARGSPAAKQKKQGSNDYLSYLKYLERSQEPYSETETSTLTSFQDWLQSPLQPLADNLESATYEVFEGDPVKYVQYEKAITAAMADWKALKRPTSAIPRPGQTESATSTPELVVAVAGAGRGPLVTRVIRASQATGVPVQLWALEKNQNAYVYLLRMNKQVWGGKVHLIKTDMREWAGPVAEGHEATGTTTKVDILVSELLGSFGDNELSPECIDGIQRHIARPHGISIPQSYTAHLSPISYPRVYADLANRSVADENAFETPWVVHLFAIDLVSQKVPGRPRFQEAWEFVHPVRLPVVEDWEAAHGRKKVQTGGGGAMTLSAGLNEHNARHCHLTFVCRPRGVIHGLAGYFESVLYQPAAQDGGPAPVPIEISTRPDRIDQKSKDMISWFPIFFPLKKPMYFPQDAEIEASMWRQTDDTKVWYEWLVEAYVWVGPTTRVKVATSELQSSRKVAFPLSVFSAMMFA